jgi:hypothetical protein
MEWKPEAYVAIYAACVSTTAVSIQFRNWLVSGPRLRCTLTPDGVVIGGDSRFDERDLVIVSATNIGTAGHDDHRALLGTALAILLFLAPPSDQSLRDPQSAAKGISGKRAETFRARSHMDWRDPTAPRLHQKHP